MGAGVILGREQFDAAIHSVSIPGDDGEQVGACLTLRAHDAALRQQVEELTRERDAAEERADEQRQRAKRAEAERHALSGVIAADDARLRAAEERVWPGKTWGCDAPEMLADEIIALRARLDAAEAALEWIRCETSDGRAEKAVADYFEEFRPDANRLLAETAQGASAEPTVESGGAPRMPAPPVPTLSLSEAREQALRVGREVDQRLAEEQAEPTPPAAEASEVEALAREIIRIGLAPYSLAEWVLRREAALRERAERAEAEVARMRSAAGRHHIDCDE